ncbi:MAG TPA: hypothetical protein VJ746_15855 [Nitrospira sp.]|nr:hypothetical protein [Nitrospira sp.]
MMQSVYSADTFFSWFTQSPITSVTMIYLVGVFAVLVFTYFEPRDPI